MMSTKFYGISVFALFIDWLKKGGNFYVYAIILVAPFSKQIKTCSILDNFYAYFTVYITSCYFCQSCSRGVLTHQISPFNC